MKNVLEYLERSAARYPDKVAFADVNEEITYAQLLQRAKEIGSALAKRFPVRTPIPIYREKSVDTICLVFGAAYAGCYYVMLDLRHPKARIEQILATLESDVVICPGWNWM